MKELDKIKRLMATYSPVTKIKDIAQMGNAIMLDKLLNKINIDLSKVDKEGFNLLYYATIGNNVDTFDYLYEKNPDLLNFETQEGKNLLHIACIYSSTNIVERILCKNRININKKDENGYTPLHESILFSDNLITDMLLKNGADKHIVTKKGLNALELGIEYDNKLKNDEDKIKTIIRRNIKTLLDNGFSLNEDSSENISYLKKAIENNNLYLIKLAIANKTPLNIVDKNGEQLIHYAANSINMNVIKILTCNGISINEKNNKSQNALMILAEKGFLTEDMLKYGLNKGLDINSIDNKGNTLLHYTASKLQLGNTSIVNLLLDKGADTNIKNIENKTPINISVKAYKSLFIENEKKLLSNFIYKTKININKNYNKKPISL